MSCNDLSGFEGAVILSQQPPAPFMTASVITNGSGHGVVLGYLGAMVELENSNAFENLGGCNVTLPSLPQCPNPKPTCQP